MVARSRLTRARSAVSDGGRMRNLGVLAGLQLLILFARVPDDQAVVDRVEEEIG